MSFVDTRFVIVVRPSLEYLIPECATAVLATLVGDSKKEDAWRAIKRLRELQVVEDIPEATHDAQDDAAELQTNVSRVCSLTHEYLKHSAAQWTRHTRAALADVRRVVREVDAAIDESRRLRDEHVRAFPGRAGIAAKSYADETRRLTSVLDARLREVRDRATPQVERPEALTLAGAKLQEGFATARGSMKSDRVVQLRNAFDVEMRLIQRDVAREFADALDAMIRA